jgi:hypothetical protein
VMDLAHVPVLPQDAISTDHRLVPTPMMSLVVAPFFATRPPATPEMRLATEPLPSMLVLTTSLPPPRLRRLLTSFVPSTKGRQTNWR